MKIVFVSGTGTEIGKTYVACAIAKTLRNAEIRVGVYKPVASGCIPAATETQNLTHRTENLHSQDAFELWEAAGRPLDIEHVCPQRFLHPVAPVEAARMEGVEVDRRRLVSGIDEWSGHCDWLIVEGAGGLFSPLAEGMLNIDLFSQLADASLMLVAPNRLGVIHDVLATVHAASRRNVACSRLLLTSVVADEDESCRSNWSQIQSWLPDLRIVEIDHGGGLDASDLIDD